MWIRLIPFAAAAVLIAAAVLLAVQPRAALGAENIAASAESTASTSTETTDSGPHGSYSAGSDGCSSCHSLHKPVKGRKGLLKRQSGPKAETGVCLACHGNDEVAGASVLTGSDSFKQVSGHVLEDRAAAVDLTNDCSACHAVHADPNSSASLPREEINGVSTKGPNGTCLACHDDGAGWKGGQPGAANPTRDFTGYPTSGTFPGRSTYENPMANPHATIPASTTALAVGDCRNCHAAHAGPNQCDGLLSEYRAPSLGTLALDQSQGTYAEACLRCHAPASQGGRARDIKSFVTTEAPEASAGHRIVTTGATYPLGAPLPCYECHNPHGSERGNLSMISDELGQNLSTSGSESSRQFCLACHATSDGQVWESGLGAYVAVTGTDMVAGLRRDGTLLPSQVSADAKSTNSLRLSAVYGHNGSDSQSCGSCHGHSYTTGGNNVHNPSAGDSDYTDRLNKPCYECHGEYQAYMEDAKGDKTGLLGTDAFHHTLGGALGDGDVQPNGAYPTSKQDLYCVSCHPRHTMDRTDGLLRSTIEASGSTVASSDYSDVDGGLCLSCHSTRLPKDTANQADDGTTESPAIGSGDGAGSFSASAHNYDVATVTGAGSPFNANCSKCHGKAAGNGGDIHLSGNRNLLAGLGAEATDPYQEGQCFRCHSTSGDAVGGTPKPFAGRDWFNAKSMSASSESVFQQYSLTSRHPVTALGGGTVECANCHNVHTTTAANPVSDPDDTMQVAPFATKFDKTQFCLKCHDGSTPVAGGELTAFVPWTVLPGPANESLMNKNAYASRAHWTANGSISGDETVACADCHDSHGSSAPKLLGVYDPATKTNRIGSTVITDDGNASCVACHDAATGVKARDDKGYLTDGGWPGAGVYASAAHGKASVVRPGTGYQGGDCKNCHDPHGTANEYDELKSTFNSSRFDLCFECHGSGNPRGLDQKRYYPVSSGGANTAPRAGHATVTPGTLLAGSALPCYDCHNPHGSGSFKGLEIQAATGPGTAATVGDGAGEIDLASSGGVRMFCFSCHTTSDTSKGYNGSSLAPVAGGTEFEGISRTSTSARLRLPASVAAHREGSANSCYNCHGNSYAAGGNNVHFPKVQAR